jgi:fibronectin-binding autotransporter adhesin
MSRIRIFVVATILVAASGDALATNYSWTQGASGNWNVAANWSPAAVPSGGDNATFGTLASAYTVQVTDTRSINNLTISGSSAALNQTGFGASLTVGGVFAVNAGTYTLSNGTLTLNGSMTTGSGASATWTGGTLAGSGTLAGTLLASGSGNSYISGTALQNSGTFAYTGGTIYGSGPAQLTNLAGGVTDFRSDGTAFDSSGTLINQGTLRKSLGAGTTVVNWAVDFQSGSTVDTQAGNINFTAGGTFHDGTINLTGAGVPPALAGGTFLLPVGGTFTAPTNAGGTSFTFSGGTLAVAGSTLAGTMTWTGGAMLGGPGPAGTLAGTLVVAAGNNKSINGTVLQNSGTFRWTGGTISTFSSAAAQLTILAGGVIDFQADGAAFDSGYASGTIVNQGVLRKSAGTGSTYVNWTVTNAGSIQNNTGTLNFAASVANTGVVTLVNGSTIAGNIASYTNGTVQGPAGGTGTYSGVLTFNNGSTFLPGGGQAGGLIVSNNLVMNGGATFFERVGGATPVTGYSRVSVGGTVTLGNATFAGDTTGFVPSGAERLFILINSGSSAVSGTFANAPSGGTVTIGQYNATISYVGNAATNATSGGKDVVLYNFAPIPPPAAIWTGAGGDNNWSTPANWAGNITPTSGNTTTVTFVGTMRLAPVQDIANPSLTLNSIAFGSSAGAFTLGGNGLTFVNNGSTLPALIQNSTSAQTVAVPLTLGNNLTVMGSGTAGLTLSGPVTGAGSLTMSGAFNLGLSNAGNTANIIVQQGTLHVDDVTSNGVGTLGTGMVTLSGGTLQYGGPTAATSKPFIFGASGGTVDVSNAATTLTLSGTVAGPANSPPGPLAKAGSGVLILNNAANTYAGGITVNGGVLAVGSDAQLGVVNPTVNPAGTLRYTASTSTARTFNLANGTLEAAAGVTLTLTGAAVNGRFLRGTGVYALASGTVFTGATSLNTTVINQTGAATYVNFSNGGALTVAGGFANPATFDGITNQGSGSITVAAGNQVNAADFQTYGVLTLTPATGNPATRLTNTGSSPLYFNGGSRTFIATPATAGQNAALVDLHGQNAIVAGGLFVNNGFVGDSTGSGATIVADFGSLVKGAGTFQSAVITQNGGKFQAGNSPGRATFGNFVFGPGGVDNYVFAIDDAAGQAGPSPDAFGHVSGWSLVKAVNGTDGGMATPGDFTWTASPADKLTLSLETLINPTTVGFDVPGPMDHFDPTHAFAWPAVSWAGRYTGPTDAAYLDETTAFDTSGFANPVSGTFGWSLDLAGRSLSLTYTPVPEPGTFLLVAAAGLPLIRRLSRRR